MLARELFRSARLKWREPTSYDKRQRFFAEEVPGRLRDMAGCKKILPRFDALVVDEAQDHDTQFANESRDAEGAGWWTIYWQLLREGVNAPMAAFFDPGQRPLFRDPGAFDVARLRRQLSQAAHVKLANTLRYTRPIYQFLKSLGSETTASLVNAMQHRGNCSGPKR